MKLFDVLKHIKYKEVINKLDLDFNSVFIDSRKVTNGSMFIGIKGNNVDGNDLYMNAFNNGSNVCVLDHINADITKYLEANNKCVIIVDNTISFLQSLAKYKRYLFRGQVVAITGSSGKTSTKDMIYSVLSEKLNCFKTEGNFNNDIGLPLTILNAPLYSDVWILEMGMNHKGEISFLSKIAKPTIAIITNIGTSHIGNLGSRENILKAKLEILDGMEDGILVINNDNDLLKDLSFLNIKVMTIGINNNSDIMAYDILLKETSSIFYINNKKYQVLVGGIHFIYNALIGYAIGKIFNIDDNLVGKGIKELKLSKNRMNIIEKNNIKIIDDCYNSNYDSCKYSLKYLGNFKGRKIAILGTMLELGNYQEYYHSLIGDVIVSEKIDILITVGECSDLINRRALELGFKESNLYHVNDNEEAIEVINSIKKEGDIILIKASHSLNFTEIVNALL